MGTHKPSSRGRMMNRRELMAYVAASGLLVGCGGSSGGSGGTGGGSGGTTGGGSGTGGGGTGGEGTDGCTFPETPDGPRVLVVGSGVAGLAAGIRILQRTGGEVGVDLITQGHFLGGKGTSWKEGPEQQYLVGHGYHAMIGYYDSMLGLLTDAGVDLSQALVSSGGINYYYENRPEVAHAVHKYEIGETEADQTAAMIAYTGLTTAEKESMNTWLEGIAAAGYWDVDAHPELDDEPFRDFALRLGASESFVNSNYFGFSRDAVFNYPEPLSTFIALKFMLAQTPTTRERLQFFVANGDIHDLLFKPLLDYFLELGGKICYRLKATKIAYDGDQVTGVEVGQPAPPASHCGSGQWPDGIVSVGDDPAVMLEGYSAYVFCIPHTAFLEINAGDQDFWNMAPFADIPNLRAVSTISMHFWCGESVGTEDYFVNINGMPQPMATVADYAKGLPMYQDGPFKSVIDCVGPLAGYEDHSDDELFELVAAGIASVPGLSNPLEADLRHKWIRRNTGTFGQLVVPVPGQWAYRPEVTTAFTNLFLAGDWVRNSLAVPSMEGAIRSAEDAVETLLASL